MLKAEHATKISLPMQALVRVGIFQIEIDTEPVPCYTPIGELTNLIPLSRRQLDRCDWIPHDAVDVLGAVF